jgi:hypothetical protein
MSKKLKGKAKAKARKMKQRSGAILCGVFPTKPWMGVVQDYIMVVAPQLKNKAYESGNSIKIGDKYVIAFNGDATSYGDVDKAYLTEYANNVNHGYVKDLIAREDFVLDADRYFNGGPGVEVGLLEWVDENNTTALERANKEVA